MLEPERNPVGSPHQSFTGMVVNDDPAELGLIASTLELDHMSVQAFPNAEEALAALNAGFAPDFIVTDLHMPGIDGWRFCRLMRSPQYPAFNHTPILVISATISGKHAGRITADLGANAFMPAPFAAEKLRQHVRAMLAGDSVPDVTTLLIIEDNRGLCELLQPAFEAHGYHVHCAFTAADGRAGFRQHAPQIVLIDYHLPDLPGQLLLQEFKRDNPLVVVIMMTGDPSAVLAVELMRAGADAYVQKPFLTEHLIAVCQQASRERALLGVEEALRRAHEELDATLNALPDLMFEVDREGRIYNYRAPCPEMLFAPPHKFMGKKLSEVLPESAATAIAEALAQAAEAGQHRGTIYSLETPAGPRWFELSIAAKGERPGAQGHFIALARDTTERHHAEEERRRLFEQTQRDAQTKAELLNEVNHRVKNNLIAIQGLLLAEERTAPLEGRAFVEPAMENLARRIGGLLQVHQMLSDSQWAPIVLSHLADHIIQGALHAAPSDRHIAVEISPSDIEVSPRQATNLALIFNELATNTIKHALTDRPQLRIGLQAWRQAGMIGIEYRDDGPGYPGDVLRFERLNAGLRLIRQLVTETLRGKLTLASQDGAFTTMSVRVEARNRT